jgi:hypothetical protein
MKILIIFAVLALCACVSPEQEAAEHQRECRDYGFQLGSPEFARCRMALAAREDHRRRAFGAAVAGGLNAQAEAYRAQARAYRQPTTCRTRRFGDTLTTTCD